jgi:hypothetical protein
MLTHQEVRMSSTTPNATTTPRTLHPSAETGLVEQGRAAVDDIVAAARGTAEEIAARLPDAASATRSALIEAERQINAGSDEMVAIGAALSFGFAAGLLIGGSNRLIIAVALVPAAFLGGSLVARLTPTR